jgi:rubredoxin
MLHVCSVCGYEYNDDIAMIPFDKLTDDWHCPVCNAPKSVFQSIVIDYSGDG